MKMRTHPDSEAGFSLIELTFVIMILAILIAMATMTYSGFQTRATTDLVNVDLKVIRAAVQMYYMNHQAFPPSLNTLLTNGYMDEIPKDKFAPGTDYQIDLSVPGKFTIRSKGPDGNDGGGDDIILTFGP